MAERRMFAKTIIDSDQFLDLPLSTQALYFHLSMRADDDGFVNNPKKIQRTIGATEEDLNLLNNKAFIIPFESGIVVISHWKIHNYIQKDRYKPTIYEAEKNQLERSTNGMYTKCIQDVSETDTQVSIGKVSIGKVSEGEANAHACESESEGKPVENSNESNELPPHQSDTYKAARVFKDIWEAYPPHRRGSRSEALNVFKETYSPGVDLLNALSIFKASDEWQKENGRFVPALSKWLDSRAWESDLVKASNEKTQLEEAILKRGQERMAALSAMQKEVKG